MPSRKEVLIHLDKLLANFFDLGEDDAGPRAAFLDESLAAYVADEEEDAELYCQVIEHFGLEFEPMSFDADQDRHEFSIWSKWTSRRKIVDWLMKYEGQLDIDDEANGCSSNDKPNAWVVGNPHKTKFLSLREIGGPVFVKTIFQAEFFKTKKEAVRWIIKSNWHWSEWKIFRKTAVAHPVRIEFTGD